MKVETFVGVCEDFGVLIDIHYYSNKHSSIAFIMGYHGGPPADFKVTPEYLQDMLDEHIIEYFIRPEYES